MMTLEEKKEFCCKLLFSWMSLENDNKDMKEHKDDIADLFTSKMILKKFEVFNIDIVLPDPLLVMLYVCTEGNPGQFQIVLKDLLNHIKKRQGLIPKGYVITCMDFCLCFPMNYPITEIPEINDKYNKLWDEQKVKNNDSLSSDNLCDTIKWWKEVME